MTQELLQLKWGIIINNLATSNKKWIKYENCNYKFMQNENDKWKGAVTSFLEP